MAGKRKDKEKAQLIKLVKGGMSVNKACQEVNLSAQTAYQALIDAGVKRRNWNTARHKEALKLLKSGVLMTHVSKKTGFHSWTLHKILERAGVKYENPADKRQKEAERLSELGYNKKQIAKEMGLAEKTVSHMIRRRRFLYEHLGIHEATQINIAICTTDAKLSEIASEYGRSVSTISAAYKLLYEAGLCKQRKRGATKGSKRGAK